MMGFVGWVLGYLWLLCALYVLGKGTGWMIFHGGLGKICEAIVLTGRNLIFFYWEMPLRKITGRPVHAKVLSKIEKLENDLGYRVELLADPARLAGSIEDVIWFQKAHGLIPDGKIGPKTLAVVKMIERKRKLAGEMIDVQGVIVSDELAGYMKTEAIVNRQLIKAANNFTVTTTAGRPDLDRLRLIALQTKIDMQYGRMWRNGS